MFGGGVERVTRVSDPTGGRTNQPPPHQREIPYGHGTLSYPQGHPGNGPTITEVNEQNSFPARILSNIRHTATSIRNFIFCQQPTRHADEERTAPPIVSFPEEIRGSATQEPNTRQGDASPSGRPVITEITTEDSSPSNEVSVISNLEAGDTNETVPIDWLAAYHPDVPVSDIPSSSNESGTTTYDLRIPVKLHMWNEQENQFVFEKIVPARLSKIALGHPTVVECYSNEPPDTVLKAGLAAPNPDGKNYVIPVQANSGGIVDHSYDPRKDKGSSYVVCYLPVGADESTYGVSSGKGYTYTVIAPSYAISFGKGSGLGLTGDWGVGREVLIPSKIPPQSIVSCVNNRNLREIYYNDACEIPSTLNLPNYLQKALEYRTASQTNNPPTNQAEN